MYPVPAVVGSAPLVYREALRRSVSTRDPRQRRPPNPVPPIVRMRWLLRVALVGVFLAAAGGIAEKAIAQPSVQDGGIFRRYLEARDAPNLWQVMPEFPVAVRPQFGGDATIGANAGVNLLVAYRPGNRLFNARSYDFARVSWRPKGCIEGVRTVCSVQVIQFDVTEFLYGWVYRAFTIGFGIGLGFMDGEIVYGDGTFGTRLEPFIPVALGVGIPLGKDFLLGLKVAQSSFFGPGPVVSMTRALVGLGYNF
jgi:hypothetical protein